MIYFYENIILSHSWIIYIFSHIFNETRYSGYFYNLSLYKNKDMWVWCILYFPFCLLYWNLKE